MSFIDGIKEALGAAPVVTDDMMDEAIASTDPKPDDAKKDEPKDAQKDESKDAPKADEPKDVPKDAPAPDDSSADDSGNDYYTDDATKQDDELSRKIINEAIAASDKPQDNPKPIQKEERNQMREFEFYKKIGSEIHDFDSGKGLSDNLRSWINGAIEDDIFLSEDFVRRVLPRVLKKNPELIAFVKDAIKRSADSAPVPFKLLFVNVKDADDKKEYESMHDACETIRREIDVFGINPADVFKPIYRRCDEAGNVGERVSVEVVESFIDSFDGDKAALRKKLRLPKRDKADKKPNTNKKQPSKKGDKKPNNNANNGGNASQNASDAT